MKTKRKLPVRLVAALAGVLLVLTLAFLYVAPSDEHQRLQALERLMNKTGAHLQEQFVSAEGIRTHAYKTLPVANTTPLLLIHGAGEGAVSWYPILFTLAQHRQVVAPDVPGYGESDKPNAGYDARFYSDWLLAFLDAEHIEKADLVGSSQGGAIAFHFAQAHPDRVGKLVLIDSAGSSPVPLSILIHFSLLNTFPNSLLQNQALSYLVLDPKNVDSDWVSYGVLVQRMPGGKNVFWQGQGEVVKPVPPSELRAFQTPTFVLWGQNDTFFPLEQGRVFAQRFSNATFVEIPHAGHLPFFDQPDQVAQAILSFLD